VDPNEFLHEYLLVLLKNIYIKFDLIRNVIFSSNLQVQEKAILHKN